MKIKYAALLFFALHSAFFSSKLFAQAPLWDWGRGVTSNPGYIIGNGTAIDRSGNAYVVGYSEPDCNPYFGGGDTLHGTSSPFLVKYDPNGNVVWTRTIIGLQTGGFEIFWGVTVDSQGDIIVVGTSNSPAIVAGDDTLAIDGLMLDPDHYRRKIFLVKYDSSGNELWLKEMPHSTTTSDRIEEYGLKIAAGQNNDIFLSGGLTDLDSTYYWIFGADTIFHSTTFVAAFSSSGTALWAKPYGAMGLSVDPMGKILVSGDWYSTTPYMVVGTDTLYGRGAFNGTDTSYFLSYITKLDVNGSPEWAVNCGAIYSQNYFSPGLIRGLTTDGLGNVFISSDWMDTLFIGTDSLVSVPDPNNNLPIFLAKYDSSGNYLWALSDTMAGYGIVDAIVCDKAGNLYVGGNTYGNVINKFDPNGTYQWSKSLYPALCQALAVDTVGNLIATGIILDGVTYDFDGDTVVSSSGPFYLNGYFAAKLHTDLATWIQEPTQTFSAVVYPNPVRNILQLSMEASSSDKLLEITDYSGRVVWTKSTPGHSADIDCSMLPSGIYILRILANEKSAAIRFIVE